jgi:SAM-dependent methyltransferase
MGELSGDDFSAFYKSFSERFRGPFESVKARLRLHADFLAAHNVPGPIVDLGVGRGEWLELAREAGLAARGVDSNPNIVADARARGFEVIEADALDFLEATAPGSLGAVTAFHLIEHLTPQQRLRLLRGAHRALASGGVLLLEWPNIGHPRVAQVTFWLDPTHQSPLPGELAAFMAEYAGFVGIDLVRIDAGEAVGFEAMDVALRASKP